MNRNKRIIWGIWFVFLTLAFVGNASSQQVSVDRDILDASLMRPDLETLHQWIREYEAAPRAYIDEQIASMLAEAGQQNVGTSLSLLSNLQYTPSERNQGPCGNCWVWAGTGAMEIAMDVQNGLHDRLSIQFFDSCDSDLAACCGGFQILFANWYSSEGFAIPWSSSNASFQDWYRPCGWAPAVACGNIPTSPKYPITSIEDTVVVTQGISQATAIANIKNVLNQNKGVVLSFYLANNADWNDFFDFWFQQDESAVWDPDPYCGHTWVGGEGAGHAVLIVGYDDRAVTPYWLVLNSWGAPSNRPNGLFRLKMNMNYSCIMQSDSPWYSKVFETLDIQYVTPPLTISGHVANADGSALSGVTLTGLPGNPSTDPNGNYDVTVPYGWVGTVTPRKTGYTFNPVSRTYPSVTSFQQGQDYIDTLNASLAAAFGPLGLWMYRNTNAAWSQLTPALSNLMATYGGNKLVANFPGYGLYQYNGTAWTFLTLNSSVENIVGVSSAFYADYGSLGLWEYYVDWAQPNGAWAQITPSNPDKMAANGNNLLATFPGFGLYQYDGTTWTLLSPNSNVENMLGISGTVYADYGTSGLWKYHGTWTPISPNTNKMQNYNGKLVANFPGYGLYLYDGTAWTLLTSNDSVQDLIGVSSNLYADYGTLGLCKYNGTWTQITAADPNHLGSYGEKLVGNFPGHGLYEYDGSSWALLTPNSGETNMVGVGALPIIY